MPSEPSISGLLNLLGSGLSQAYEYVVPDYYSRDAGPVKGAYSGDQWGDWYGRSRQVGTPEFSQHQDWLRLAQPRYQQRMKEYILHLKSQPQTNEDGTPSDAALTLRQLQGPIGFQMRNQLYGMPPIGGEQVSQAAQREAQLFFNWLQGTSLFGDDRPDTSVTQEGMDEWKQDSDWGKRWQSDWRMTPAGQEAFKKLLDYNLLNAFQQGVHQPEPLNTPTMSGIGGAIGYLAEGMFNQDNWVDSAPGTEIPRAQMELLASPSPAKAMQYAMEVARFAETQDPEFYNSWMSGSAAPQMSLMTGEGLARKSGSGDTPYGRATRVMSAPFLMPQRGEDDRQALTEFMNANQRGTPIRPADTYEEAERLRRAGETIENNNWKQISAYLPKWIRDFNSVFAAAPAAWGGELPNPPAGQKWAAGPGQPQLVPLSKEEQEYEQWRQSQSGAAKPPADNDPWAKVGITPFHSTAAFNDALMIGPAILGDPGNALVSAIAGPFAALSKGSLVSGLRAALASNIGDVPSENLYNTALSLTASPQTIGGYFTEPDPANPVRDEAGNIPPADSPRYLPILKAYERGITNDIDDMESHNNELRRRQPKPHNPDRSSDPILGKPFFGVK